MRQQSRFADNVCEVRPHLSVAGNPGEHSQAKLCQFDLVLSNLLAVQKGHNPLRVKHVAQRDLMQGALLISEGVGDRAAPRDDPPVMTVAA